MALACAVLWCPAARADDALPPVSAFFATPSMSAVQLSPQGHQVAMVMSFADGRQGIIVRSTADLAKSKALTQVDGVDANIDAIHWINERRLGFTVKNLRKNAETYYDEFAIDTDGGTLRHLISGNWRHVQEAQVGSRISNRTLPAGHVYVGPTNDDTDDIVIAKVSWNNIDLMSQSSRLYRLDTRSQTMKSAFDGAQPAGIKGWILDHAAVPRIASSRNKGECVTSLRQPGADSWTEIDRGSCVNGLRFTPLFFHGEQTLFVKANYQGYDALYQYDTAKRELAKEPVVETAGFDFSGYPEIDVPSRAVMGLHFVTDANSTVWFHPALKADQARIDALLPGSINTVSCPASCLASPVLLVRRQNDRIPTEYALYTRATGKLSGLGGSYPDIVPASMGQRSFHRYKARDGREIPAYVTLPVTPSSTARPAVVLVHGGPTVRGSSWEWDEEAAFLASRGYVVIQPEYRGGTGFGHDHLDAGSRQWGGTMQDDLTDAARWAVSQGWADARRIGIMGASYGGYATLMGLIKDPQVFRTGVAWAAVTDLRLMFTSLQSDATEDMLAYDMRTLIGDPDNPADAELFRRSPLQRAAELHQPLLLAHGHDDLRVPFEHATAFYSAVRQSNRQVELLTYDDEGHGWRKQQTRYDFWHKVERFLDTHLKQAQ